MKVIVICMHGSAYEKLKLSGYKHKQVLEVENREEMFDHADLIMETGLNVCFLHCGDGYILGVDTKKFNPR